MSFQREYVADVVFGTIAVTIREKDRGCFLDGARMDVQIENPELAKPLKRRAKHMLANQNALSLCCLFQILTACCIFFACLKISPLLAIVGTIIVTPAIIRTGLASEVYRQDGKAFSLIERLRWFFHSVGVVLFLTIISLGTFALVSLCSGCVCVALSAMAGHHDLIQDIAVLGTAGGMIWGAAGSMVAGGYCAKKSWPVTSSERSS